MRELADPETIQAQKESYAKDLEEQLRRGVEVLGDTHKKQTEALHSAATQERTRYNLAMDQQVKQQELQLSQEYNEQLMRLQQAAQAKRAELETQATSLTLEFQQRKVQEEFMAQRVGIQQQHLEAQKRIEDEMRKLGIDPSVSTFPGFGGHPTMHTASSQATFAPAIHGVQTAPTIVTTSGDRSFTPTSVVAPGGHARMALRATSAVRASYAMPSTTMFAAATQGTVTPTQRASVAYTPLKQC